jgi:hypothetical protein
MNSLGVITAAPRALGPRIEVEVPEIACTIWFEWQGPASIVGIKPPNANFALLAALPVAMKRSCDLHVRGAVDTKLLANAERYATIWSQWRPDKYKPTRIFAESEIEDEARPGSQPWTYPFSGGVDSMFSIFANRAGDSGRDNRTPGSVFLVRGFDYSLSDTKFFPLLEQRVSSIAQSLGLPMLVCSTNWKEFCIQYELDTQLGLSAIAHTLSATHAGVSIAADFTFGEDLKIMPWGNNQYMPHLLGSSQFQVAGGGADTLRVDKMAYLGKVPAALSMLCICRAPNGSDNRFNCEECEKCIRTAMGLYVATGNVKPTFARLPSPYRILSIKGLSQVELIFWIDILRRMPRRDHAARLAIKTLIARSRLRLGFNALLQPLEKQYIRPLHARIRSSLGS